MLDQGQLGSALFLLTSQGANYLPGLVRYDGQSVEIDLTSLTTNTQGVLVFQLINGDQDTGTLIQVQNLSNTTDPNGFVKPVFPVTNTFFSPGPALNLSTLTNVSYLQPRFSNVHFDVKTGQYVADLQVKNTGSATSRQVAVVFSGLPVGVTLVNASGVDGNGNPYVTLSRAIKSGGLDRNAISDPVQVVFSDPNLLRFTAQPQVYAFTTNRPPSFVVPDTLTVTPGQTLRVSLNGTDPDGDAVLFTIASGQSLPTGTLDQSGTLIFNPTPAEMGRYALTLVASDGGLQTRKPITLQVVPDPITATRISGVVLDLNQSPLAGVSVELRGGATTTTAADGSFQFSLPGALADDVLIIRANNVSGAKSYPPYVPENIPHLLGHDVYSGYNNVISRPIYLPAIDVANGTLVNPNQDARVSTPSLPGAGLVIKAGTLQTLNGSSFTGVVSITEVPVDLTPAALPSNLYPDVVVSIQPGGNLFTTPAPLSLPNRAGYAPGSQLDLWSLNPITGLFEQVGLGQVSPDGKMTETIEGGVRSSSWHFFVRPPALPSPPPGPRGGCNECKATGQVNSDVELDTGAVIEAYNLASYQSQGETRGIALRYDSLNANPQGIIHFAYDITARIVDITARTSNGALNATVSLKQGNFTYHAGAPAGRYSPDGGENFWGFALETGSINASLLVDLSSFNSGVVSYDVTTGLGTRNSSSGQFFGSTATFSNTLINNNKINSAFGSGWDLVGLQNLVTNADGSVLLLDGDGSQLLFTPSETPGVYNSGGNDFSILTQRTDGTWQRVTKDQTVYHFNTQLQLDTITEPNGYISRYVYNGTGQLIQMVDPAGLVTTFSYTGNQVSSITDPMARRTQLVYDGEGNLVRVIPADQSSQQWEYDRHHQLTAAIDPLGSRGEDIYNFAGRVVSATLPDGSVVRVAPYDTVGLYRPEETIDITLAPKAFRVPTAGTLNANYANETGNVTRTQLDSAGQTIQSLDGTGLLPIITRDFNTNLVTSTQDGQRNTTSYLYDAKGNVISIQDLISGAGAETGGGTSNVSFITSNFPIGENLLGVDEELVDLNGDRFPDLVTDNINGSISILLGNGTGKLSPPVTYLSDYFQIGLPLGLPLGSISVGDVNGDSIPDIVVIFDTGFSVLLGNGEGEFAAPIQTSLPGRMQGMWEYRSSQ